MTQVLVVGAGIGGLTAALSLHAAGVGCAVVDAARRLTSAGVGINLLPHAVRELTELGLGEDLAALGVATAELTADWTARGRLNDVLPHYADWNFGWLDVPGLIRSSEPILVYPMVDRDPLDRWGTGSVTLVGDAAHPMYPIGSNGGSQAILDARVLAYHLATASDVPTALAGYERERRDATSVIVLAQRSMGPERILRTVAERAPDGFARIEDVLSERELAAIDDAYRSTTGTDAAALNTRASWNIS